MEVSADGFKDELKNRTALLGASGDRRPDPLEPAPSSFAPRALGYVSVDDHEANRLLGQVVGRLEAGCRDKPDVACTVFPKATSEIGRLRCAGHVHDGRSTQRLAQQFQRGCERLSSCFAHLKAVRDRPGGSNSPR